MDIKKETTATESDLYILGLCYWADKKNILTNLPTAINKETYIKKH